MIYLVFYVSTSTHLAYIFFATRARRHEVRIPSLSRPKVVLQYFVTTSVGTQHEHRGGRWVRGRGGYSLIVTLSLYSVFSVCSPCTRYRYRVQWLIIVVRGFGCGLALYQSEALGTGCAAL